LKTTHPIRSSILLLFAIITIATDLAAQEQISQDRSIVFLPDLMQARSDGSHRPPRRIGKPRSTTPLAAALNVQSHNDVRSEFPNYNVTDFLLADQDEPFIAIDPLNANNLVAGANDYRTDAVLWSYASSDAGKTWLNQALPTKDALAIATDPSMAFDRFGNVFYANGGFETTGIPYQPNQVNVFKSVDKGKTWADPTHPFKDLTNGGANALSDKYWIAIDQNAASPFKDRIYVAWIEVANNTTRIVMSRSENGGASWLPRVNVSPTGDLSAPVPMTAPNGDVYVTYIDKSDAKQILFARSTNGGVSFLPPVKVTNYKDLGPVVPPGDINRRAYIKDFIGVNSFPSIAIDHSEKFKGRVYVSWAAHDASDVAHIYVSTSTDNGGSWSAPKAVEDNSSLINTDRFFNWIAVDKRNGDVGVVYYDSRLDSVDNRLVDLYFSHSRDGGATYTSRRVTTQSIDPHIGSVGRRVGDIDFKFFGDYIGLAVLDSNWQAVWTDTRPGNDQEIFTARIRPYAPHGVDNFRLEETPEEYPRLLWDHDPVSTFGYPLSDLQFVIRRDDGEQFIVAQDKREYTDESVEGLQRYTYTITVRQGSYESIGRDVRFIPIRTRKPQQVEFISSQAKTDGFNITIRIPEKNEVNRDLVGLDTLYVVIDGAIAEVLPLSDIYRGTQQTRAYSVTPGQYHLLKTLVSTSIEGFRTFADTATVYLWSGDAANDYSNDFEQAPSIFSPNAWSATNVAPFTSNVINDSLPNVNYGAGVNTWFLLPPVRISPQHRTLEFDHIALVSPIDVAIVEYSHNNGVSFEPGGQYNVQSHAEWSSTLANSQLVHDRVYLQRMIDSAVIVRFRLIGSVGGMDGWFIDNINFSDALTVRRADGSSTSLYPDPVRTSMASTLRLDKTGEGFATITIVDVLGRVVDSRRVRLDPATTEIPITLDAPGSYTVLVEYGAAKQIARHKLIVVP
jgi:hypothetical protein